MNTILKSDQNYGWLSMIMTVMMMMAIFEEVYLETADDDDEDDEEGWGWQWQYDIEYENIFKVTGADISPSGSSLALTNKQTAWTFSKYLHHGHNRPIIRKYMIIWAIIMSYSQLSNNNKLKLQHWFPWRWRICSCVVPFSHVLCNYHQHHHYHNHVCCFPIKRMISNDCPGERRRLGLMSLPLLPCHANSY